MTKSTPTKRSRKKTAKMWAVVWKEDGKVINAYTSRRQASEYLDGFYGQKIVPCTITYDL